MRFRHHLKQWLPAFSLLALGLLSSHAHAQTLTKSQVEELVQIYAPRVTVFKAIWEKDPAAKIFGGAARDFVYYLLHFKGTEIPDGPIDVRDFLSADSDIDVISQVQALETLAGEFGVKRIELIQSDRILAHTDLGRSEVNQGFLPTEKLILSVDGISTPKQFGDGLTELLTNKLTMHLPSRAVFNQTRFAQIGINHPMLLCLRYVRAKSRAHYELPDVGSIDDPIPAPLAARIREVTSEARYDDFIEKLEGDTFQAQKFREWVTTTIEKSVMGRVDGAYSVQLWRELGFTDVFALSPGLPKPNDLELFRSYDVRQKDALIRTLGFEPETVIHNPAYHGAEHLLHGSRDVQSVYRILLEGFLHSDEGAAVGQGIYAVDEVNEQIAKTVAYDTGALVEIWLTNKTRVVDIRPGGEGRKFYKKFKNEMWTGDSDSQEGAIYDAFAKTFGIDVLLYEYSTAYAFAIKNPARIRKKTSPAVPVLWVDSVRKVRHARTLVEIAELLFQMEWRARTFNEKMRAVQAVPDALLPRGIKLKADASAAIHSLNVLAELFRELSSKDERFEWMRATLVREMELVVKRWIMDPTQYGEFLDWTARWSHRANWEKKYGSIIYQDRDDQVREMMERTTIKAFRWFKFTTTPLLLPSYTAKAYCKNQGIDATELGVCLMLEMPAKFVATGVVGLFHSIWSAMKMSVVVFPAHYLLATYVDKPAAFFMASAVYTVSTVMTVGSTYYDIYIESGLVKKTVDAWKQAISEGWHRLKLAHSSAADERVDHVLDELTHCNGMLAPVSDGMNHGNPVGNDSEFDTELGDELTS